MINRHSIRLPNYDYSQNGAYFVTICTKNKEHLFGEIIQGTKYGEGRRFSAPTVTNANTDLVIWQRNFYEHIIRNENDLNGIREYIMNNPAQWSEDEMNASP